MKNEVRWQYLTEKEIIEAFAADIHAGLSENAVSRIRGRFGFNSIWQTEKVSAKNIVFANLFDAPVLLLLISAFLTAFVGQYPAFAVICAVLFVSCGFRICCEFLYRRAVSSNVRSGLFRVSVVRDGKMKNIFADELVPGDIVILRKGDTAGADLRIIESSGLSVLENGVTDNSGVVLKAPGRLTDSTANTPCEKWSNMVFASSEVVSGHARAVAVACGKHTLVYKKRGPEKIEGYGEAKDIAKARRDGVFFAAFLLAFSLIYTVACIFLLGGKYSISDIFIGALSFASSGAAAVYLNVLYFCRLRTIITLQKNGVILRNPSSAELAADSDVFVVRDIGDIKTGETELEAVFVSGRDRGEYAKFKNDSDARELFKILSLNSVTLPGAVGELFESGDISDRAKAAVKAFCKAASLGENELVSGIGILGFRAKDENNPCATSLYVENGEYYSACTGDIDEILPLCKKILVHGEARFLDTYTVGYIRECADSYCKRGRSIIAISKRVSPYNNMSRLSVLQTSMTFIGFVAVCEPVSPSALASVCKMADCKKAVIAFSSSPADTALFAGGCRRDVPIITPDNLKSLKRINLQPGQISAVCLYDGKNRDEKRAAVIEFLKKSGRKVTFAAVSDEDKNSLAASFLKIYVKENRAFGMRRKDVRSMADIIFSSDIFDEENGINALAVKERTFSGKMKSVRIYLMISQAVRCVFLLSVFFAAPALYFWIYLIWGIVADTLVSLTMAVPVKEKG